MSRISFEEAFTRFRSRVLDLAGQLMSNFYPNRSMLTVVSRAEFRHFSTKSGQ